MNYDYTLNADGVPTVDLSVEAPENVSLEMNEVSGRVPQIEKTTAVLKGDNNGNAAAAVPGEDYQTPLTAGTDYWQPPVIVTLSNDQGEAYISSLSDAEIFAAAVSGRFVYATLQQRGHGIILPLTAIAYSPDPLDNMGVWFSTSILGPSMGKMYTVHIIETTAYFTEQNLQNNILVNGILIGNGGSISAAIAGYDYQTPLVAGTDYQTPLPSQSGKTGKYLKTDGSDMSWEDAPAPPVTSVNSKTGAVTLGASDVGAYEKPAGGIPAADLADYYAASATAGGTASKTEAIPYGVVDNTSTSTVYTATVPGITELKDGTMMLLKNGVITSAAGFTININNLGAKPVYTNLAAATAESTKFNVNYTMLFIYDSTRVAGGCWICYNGYDSNTNTIAYQVRGNYGGYPVKTKCGRYRLLFTSADGTKYVPANTDEVTSAAKTHTTTTEKIDPFGRIVYYGSSTVIAANGTPGVSVLWSQYNLSLGYSFNWTNAALVLSYPAPVYVKCAPQSDGSAIIDSTTPYVQALPSTEDGKIYIYLGIAYSATNIEMFSEHPVYEYKNNKIRLYTGA